MNNERYNQIIDEAYENYCKSFEIDPNNFNVDELVKGHGDQCWGYPILDHVKPTSKEYKRGQINAYLEGKAEKPFFYLTQEEFIDKCKTEPSFSETYGLKIEERELTLEERYNKWFNNNYETGMERFFDPNELPDFDNSYYEPTPTKQITVTYQENKIEVYE